MGEAVSVEFMLGLGVTLFCFFGAQAVTLWIWYRKHKRDQKLDRDQQLEKLQEVVDKDIGKVWKEVSNIRQEMHENEETQRQRNEQLHGHMRRIEESRPTRTEMKEQLASLKDTISQVETRLTASVSTGFDRLDKRFEEFKEYAKELWGPPPRR